MKKQELTPELRAAMERYTPDLLATLDLTGTISSKDVLRSVTNWGDWRNKRSRLVDLGDGTEVKIRLMDVLSLLDGDGDTPNPLLAIVAGHTEGKKDPGESFMKDPQAIHSLRVTLNNVMKKVVIDPPLIEAGHPDGISVDEFTIEEKMLIFQALMGGGELLGSATGFREEPRASLVTAPDGDEVRSAP